MSSRYERDERTKRRQVLRHKRGDRVYKFRCDQNHTAKCGKNTLLPPLYIVGGFFFQPTNKEQLGVTKITHQIMQEMTYLPPYI